MTNTATGSEPVVAGQQPPTGERDPLVARLLRPAVTHWQFSLVVAAAVAVRIVVVLGYPPILWFSDSYNYLYDAVTHIPDQVRPNGYPFLLDLLLPLHSDTAIGLLQAAMDGDPAAAEITIQTNSTGSTRSNGRSRLTLRGRTAGGIACGGPACGRWLRPTPSTGWAGRSDVSSRNWAQVFAAYADAVRSSNSSNVSRPSVNASRSTSTTLSRSWSDARIGRSVIGRHP